VKSRNTLGRLQFPLHHADTSDMPAPANPYRRALQRACTWLLLWASAWPALVLAAVPQAQRAEWGASADGQWLHQRSTGLVWQRCVLGMRWNGRDCVGQPLFVDHLQAAAMARARAQTDGLAWRLPYLKELQQLARLGAQGKPALLPESTQGWVWTATVPIEVRKVNPFSYNSVMSGTTGQNVSEMKFMHAWVVNTATGESRNDVLKRTPLYVRLVRKSDEP
jgi:hypothetical protein